MMRSTYLWPLCALALVLPLHAQGVLYSFDGVEHSVAGPGDVDGDGVPDLLVGRRADGFNAWDGRVELRSGASGELLTALSQFGVPDGFGAALAGTGDIDGDGVPDFALSAPFGAQIGSVSRVRVHKAPAGQLLLELHDFDPNVAFGYAIAGGQDVGGSATPDLLVGAPSGSLAASFGRMQVHDGDTGEILRVHESSGISAQGFGSTVAYVGDLDQDGRADYAVGSALLGDGTTLPGAVTVFSGASGAVLWHVDGSGSFDSLGASIAPIGDLDGDGVPELIVGCPGEFTMPFVTGAVHVYSGASGELIHHVTQSYGIRLGHSVAPVGDVDGDGIPDFGAHFPQAFVGGVLQQIGSVAIFSGATGTLITGWASGYDGPIAAVGDVNQDGAPDLLVAGGPGNPGHSSLILGQVGEVFKGVCPPGTNSKGCATQLGFEGGPSLSTGPGLDLRASEMISEQPGLFLYGLPGKPTPFAGGTLCIDPPFRRTPVQSTGGAPGSECGGSLELTVDATFLIQHGLTPGDNVVVQALSRDPGASEGSLTNSVHFSVWP